jgi:hypothetical protein
MPPASDEASLGIEACETNPISSRRRHQTEGICARRSQTWDNWGMWAKVVLLWGVARPGSETCETNPIWGRRLAPDGGKRAEQSQLGNGRIYANLSSGIWL